MNENVSSRPLHLYEECLLLAIGDSTGNPLLGRDQMSLLAAASLFSELLVCDAISIGSKEIVEFHGCEELMDPVLNDVVAKLASAQGTYSLKQWIGRIGGSRKILERCINQLCNRGILTAKEESVMWLYTRRYYPEINPEPENKLREKIQIALRDTREVEPRLATLIAMASQFDLLKTCVSHSELTKSKKRIDQIARGDASADAARQIIAARQAAAMVVMMSPAIT